MKRRIETPETPTGEEGSNASPRGAFQIAGKVIEESLRQMDNADKKGKDAAIVEGKRKTVPIGYEFRPYFNRTKKHHLCKLILVEKNLVRGHIYRTLVARNFPLAQGQSLSGLPAEEVAQAHAQRKIMPRYGG